MRSNSRHVGSIAAATEVTDSRLNFLAKSSQADEVRSMPDGRDNSSSRESSPAIVTLKSDDISEPFGIAGVTITSPFG